MPEFTNISAYRFTPLTNLSALQKQLLRACVAGCLKGTILLSPEGINVFVAGEQAAIAALLSELRGINGLETLLPKVSLSAEQPFDRMFVKIKKEIIAFGVDGIDPANRPTRKVSPQILKQWLDERRPITLLDTRNEYEVRMGTFRGAVSAGIRHFREFPEAVRELPETLKHQPVVMFCTGGIRCEKAGPLIERLGFKDVHQLDGGILKYFEECGASHYEGECFVFDQRVGLDAALQPTGSVLCGNCQTPLTREEQKHSHYVAGSSCQFCRGTHERVGRTALG